MEKNRIMRKNSTEGRKMGGNRRRQTETDGDRRRMFETKFYVTIPQILNKKESAFDRCIGRSCMRWRWIYFAFISKLGVS